CIVCATRETRFRAKRGLPDFAIRPEGFSASCRIPKGSFDGPPIPNGRSRPRGRTLPARVSRFSKTLTRSPCVHYSPKLEAILASASGHLSGLDPTTWIVVEPGISREEVKEYYLSRGIAFVSTAIQDVSGFCRWILGPLVDPKRVLGTPSRQEVLRRILSDREFSEVLPEIRRLKRQRDFYRKLDRTIQSARMTFVSPQEREAQEERLRMTSTQPAGVRREVALVIEAYEAWLAESRAWDTPRLLLAAIGALSSPEVELAFPPRIVVLSAKRGESRGEALWEALAKRGSFGEAVEVERIFVSELGDDGGQESSPASSPALNLASSG